MGRPFDCRSGISALLLVSCAAGTQAQESPEAGRLETGPVLLELFEFIGEFTTDDGEWVDPAALLDVDANVLAVPQTGGAAGSASSLGRRGEADAAVVGVVEIESGDEAGERCESDCN